MNAATHEQQEIAGRVARLAADSGLSIGVAESLTSGSIASVLGAAPGASDWFTGGIVAYDAEVKFRLLGVKRGPIVTPACARAMVRGTIDALGCDLALAVTGVGGPGPSEGSPAGTVHMAYGDTDTVEAVENHWPGEPALVVERCVTEALLAIECLLADRADAKQPVTG